jgi:hypothetical protein
MPKKDRAAQALGRKRWKGVPKEERSRQMSDTVKVRWARWRNKKVEKEGGSGGATAA